MPGELKQGMEVHGVRHLVVIPLKDSTGIIGMLELGLTDLARTAVVDPSVLDEVSTVLAQGVIQGRDQSDWSGADYDYVVTSALR